MNKYVSFLIILIFSSCISNEETNQFSKKLFQPVSMDRSGINFVNHIEEDENLNGILYEHLYNGGGVAVGDFNADQLPDLYFVSNVEPDQIYLNQGGLSFKDISEVSGVLQNNTGFNTGVSVVDINTDGMLDIYVCRSGKYVNQEHRRNLLYVNQGLNADGVPTFKESAGEYGLDLPHYSTQASFFDYDKDGDLDVFLINHGNKIYEDKYLMTLKDTDSPFQSELLLRNENGVFVNVSKESGLINNGLSYGLGIAVSDYNNDSWPDVLVSHDFNQKDHLYLNNQDGTFTESILNSTKHISYFSMGSDAADINNDGMVDFMTVDMVGENSYDIKTSMSGMNPEQFYFLVDRGFHHQYMFNCLQLNQGNVHGVPQFSDIAQLSGVSNTDWSWGPLFFDADNDGYKDLFVGNGVKRDFRNNDFNRYKEVAFQEFFALNRSRTKENKQKARKLTAEMVDKMPSRKKPNRIYKNLDGYRFHKTTDWIEDIPNASNGAVYADLDLDGDLDLVVNNMDDPSLIYENTLAEPNVNYLRVRLKGSDLNPMAIGARVSIDANGKGQLLENFNSRGFQSSSVVPLHFGVMGEVSVSLKVEWPDGKVSTFKEVGTNQEFTARYEDAAQDMDLSEKLKQPWQMVDADQVLPFDHQENPFYDFGREGLLPHQMSRFGPALAVGDVNGDQRVDIFVGGASKQASSLFIQNKDGDFELAQTFDQSAMSEDVNAKFVDLDADGDLDLYVATGGNEFRLGAKELNDRIYENENGSFKLVNWSKPINGSAGRVKLCDFDKDGDLDMLVTGRQVPGQYPKAANTYLLKNMAQASLEPELVHVFESIGMVTDAEWLDIDGDTYDDVILVGEWMAPVAFRNNQVDFSQPLDIGLSDYTGWYFSIAKGDFNEDGSEDLIVGNNGLNYKYKADMKEPFQIYVNDFDGNGDEDIVLAYAENGTQVPVRGRQCSSQEMPYIKKKFETYDQFASAAVEEIYGNKKLKESLNYSATTFASAILFNKQDGSFDFSPLPDMAQLSSINSIELTDQDEDGHIDLILAGNFHVSEVETPRNDASYGTILRGDGKGNFDVLTPNESGLYMDGDVRDMALLTNVKDEEVIVLARNDSKVKVFKKKGETYLQLGMK